MELKAIQADTLLQKLPRIHWPFILLVTAICCFGFVLLYGAAGGSLEPYAGRQMVRFGVGLVVMCVVSLIDLKLIFQLAYFIYGIGLVLLAMVPVIGYKAMGAQSWIDLGFMNLQPSEVVKVGLILAIARYYHMRPMVVTQRVSGLIVPLLLIMLPAALTIIQPDLGTGTMLIIIGAGMMFFCGVHWKYFAFAATAVVVAMPLVWSKLYDHQKGRILTFLDPERDPMGAGYHIMQSKIAIGSAGFWGKGFMEGSQSHLMFLPEKHTDFIFTLLTEDFGMAGAILLLGLYVTLLLTIMSIAMRSFSQFGAAVAIGVLMTIFAYMLVNISMVMGLMPVVGVPLPFISYGGTSLMTMMLACGLAMNVYVHRTSNLPAAKGLATTQFTVRARS